jgi:hypothetical protein
MVGIAGQIQCPCLVMEAEADMFLSGQPQQIYDALKAPKQLVKFTSQDGAENHCQSGALAYKDEVVFNWLDQTLRVNSGNEDSTERRHSEPLARDAHVAAETPAPATYFMSSQQID